MKSRWLIALAAIVTLGVSACTQQLLSGTMEYSTAFERSIPVGQSLPGTDIKYLGKTETGRADEHRRPDHAQADARFAHLARRADARREMWTITYASSSLTTRYFRRGEQPRSSSLMSRRKPCRLRHCLKMRSRSRVWSITACRRARPSLAPPSHTTAKHRTGPNLAA